jgi:tetratricopeptide (TPR) repeat protein
MSAAASGASTIRGLLARGQFAEAERQLNESMQQASSAELLWIAGEIAESRGDLQRALELTFESAARHGENARLLLRRAQLLVNLWRRPEAIDTARRAASLAAGDAAMLTAIAKFHLQGNDPSAARPLLSQACDLEPRNPAVLFEAAMCSHYFNEPETAAALLERVLELAPGNGFALYARSQLRVQTAGANHAAEIQAALARTAMPVREAIAAWFALAKELEDLGRWEESFAALQSGNRLKRSTLRYEVGDDIKAMRNVRETFDATQFEPLGQGDVRATGTIFIVGMPRTGTTLLERILASHSAVASVGETVDFPILMTDEAGRAYEEHGMSDASLLKAATMIDWSRLGGRYLAGVRELSDRPYTLDKLPFNFRYCGLIRKALPGARILHVRRHPLDTCYAVFKSLFEGAYHFSYRLDELAEYYVAYRETMDHWHAVMPGAILDVHYEDLVSRPLETCQAALDWCGLPWEQGVLDFHRSPSAAQTASAAQVRRPIYSSSVGSWRRVAAQMQPALQHLQAAGLVDADGQETGRGPFNPTTCA